MKGFTLVEMLIVMAIIMLLIGLGFVSTSGMRKSYQIHNFTTTLEEDIKYAQRAAMLLERAGNESWVYGIGIDFRSDSTTEKENQGDLYSYKMFKWCSQYPEYSPTIEALNGELPYLGQDLPGYESVIADIHLGVMPLDYCSGQSNLVMTKRNLSSGLRNSIGHRTGAVRITSEAQVVLFESVTGRAFLYGADNKLKNYSVIGDDVQFVSQPEDLVIQIGSGENKRTLSIKPVSGRTELFYGEKDYEKTKEAKN